MSDIEIKSWGDLALYLVLVGLVVAGLMGFKSCSCSTKAKAMALKSSDWGPIQGCIVETKKGDKIDIQRYRVVD
jgi:hypothetical protein